MITKILHKSLAQYMHTENGKDALRAIAEMKQHPGWKYYSTMLLGVGNDIANIALSRNFQQKTDKEKLIMLEAFSHMSDFIKFVLNPNPQLERILQIHQKNQEASQQRKRPKGVKHDGRKRTIHKVGTYSD